MHHADKDQQTLFESSMDLVHELAAAPKLDLHRHLTGSITAELAVRVAAIHKINLPSYIAIELHEELFGQKKVQSLEEYFVPWTILNRLFISPESIRAVILDVVRRAADDNVIYLELRTSPRGFLGSDGMSFEAFLECVVSSSIEAESLYGTTTRWIIGIPRHIFGRIPADTANRMYGQMVRKIRTASLRYFVGVDLNGVETAARPEQFEAFFKIARENGLKVTAHAGEVGPADYVRTAVEALGASRIGHGIAAAQDHDLLELLARRSCALEICPTSNKLLGIVDQLSDLPFEKLLSYRVPFVICTDNPARCQTSLTEELLKVSQSCGWTSAQVRQYIYSALNFSFADHETREYLRSRLDGFWSARKHAISSD